MTLHPDDILGQIEERASRRFVHWDPTLWQSILDGPAQRLTRSLVQDGDEAHARSVLTAYLTLASHGVGLGYLFDGSDTNTENFLVRAWFHLIPELLPALAPGDRAEALADCWNLGENLEHSPPWLRRVFLHLSRDLEDLSDLEDLVIQVERVVSEEPERTLKEGVRATRWIHLAEVDPHFLPGPVVFMGPTLACVHDRLRTDSDGNSLTLGVWLDEDEPVIVGAMGPQPLPDEWIQEDVSLHWSELDDPRATALHASAANDWRGVYVMETSQFLVALLP